MATQEKLLTTLEELVDPEYAGLVVIDMQNDFCHQDGFFGRGGNDARGHGQKPVDLNLIEEMAPNLLKLIDAARSAGIRIYFIRNFGDDRNLPPMMRLRKLRIGRTRVLCPEKAWGGEQYDGFVPQPGDTVIKKHVNSAFIGTDLQEILKKDGIKSIMVTGVATNICCESTIRDGSMMGFYIVIPRDCVGGYNREAHEDSLSLIDFNWGWVTTSEEITALWQKRSKKPGNRAK